MIDGGLYDACLAEQGRRLYLPPVPIPACSCEQVWQQQCECLAEPDIATWSCSECGVKYLLLD